MITALPPHSAVRLCLTVRARYSISEAQLQEKLKRVAVPGEPAPYRTVRRQTALPGTRNSDLV